MALITSSGSSVSKLREVHLQHINNAGSTITTSSSSGSHTEPKAILPLTEVFLNTVDQVDLKASLSPRSLSKDQTSMSTFKAGPISSSSSSIKVEEPTSPRSPKSSRSSIFARFSPRGHSQTLNPSNKKLSDSEIALTEGSKAENINKNARGYFRKQCSERPQGDVSHRKVEEVIDQTIDNYLAEEYFQSGSYAPKVNSPRSAKVLTAILSNLRSGGLLIAGLLVKLEQLNGLIMRYTNQKKTTTIWLQSLKQTVETLLAKENDLTAFLNHLESIPKGKIKELIEFVMGNEYPSVLKMLRSLDGSEAIKMLRKHYEPIYVDFEDLQKVLGQQLSIEGDGNKSLNMADIINEFINDVKTMKSLKVNGTPLDLSPVQTEMGSALSQSQQNSYFLTHFLWVYFTEKNIEVSPDTLTNEVNEMLNGVVKPSRKLLWLFTAPWKIFLKKIEVVFASLKPLITHSFVPETASMDIQIQSDGLTFHKSITCDCFTTGLSSEGKAKKIAEIEFRMTFRPFDSTDDNFETTWQGSIQIQKLPVMHTQLPYSIKSKLIKQLIIFPDINNPHIFKEVELIEAHDHVSSSITHLIQKLNVGATVSGGPYVSWYTLQYYVRNLCRLSLHEAYDVQAQISPAYVANMIWEKLQADRHLLEPILLRVKMFRSALLDYVMSQKYRIKLIDELFEYLDLVISSRNLEAFNLHINMGVRHEGLNAMALNNIFGMQEDIGTNETSMRQLEHLNEVFRTLKLINSGPNYLVRIVNEVWNDMNCIDQSGIIGVPHKFLLSPQATAQMRQITAKNVVRTFMQSGTPLMLEVVVNGILIKEDDLNGTDAEKRELFFTRLLTEIYKKLDPNMQPESIAQQVHLLLTDPFSTSIQIPALSVLQLCAITGGQMYGAQFFHHRFNLDDSPFKSIVKPQSSCYLTVNGPSDYMVEFKKSVIVYPRGIPERNDVGGSIDKNRVVAEIPFSFQLSTLAEAGGEQMYGMVQIEKIRLDSKMMLEEKYQIQSTLYQPNEEFLKNSEWETKDAVARLIRPLGEYPKERTLRRSGSLLRGKIHKSKELSPR